MTTDRIGLAIHPDTNDLFLRGDGQLAIVRQAEAVGQHVRQRLKTFKGEWFLDTEAGMTWLDEVFAHRYDPALAESLVKAEILDTDGIQEILTFNVSFQQDKRNLVISEVEVLTMYDSKAVI